MKFYKLCFISTLLIGSLSTGCSHGNEEAVITSKSDNANGQFAAAQTIDWQKIGELPAAGKFTESLGISAAYSGFLGDYLIVAGGANFPKGHPIFESGKKEYYSDIFVFDVSDNKLTLVSRGHLPIKSGYGATVVVGDSLYLVGGQNNEQALGSIIKLSLDNNKAPKTEVIGTLPFTFALGKAAWHNNALYLFAGQQDKKATNNVCKVSIERQSCINTKNTPPVPGAHRVQFSSVNSQGTFYVFGGLNFESKLGDYVLTDAYAFDFRNNSWKELSATTVAGQPFAITGGGVVPISDNKLLFLGGVNKKIFDNAIYQLNHLKGDALLTFKSKYFAMPPKDFYFSQRQVIYNVKENSWEVLAVNVPFPGGAGPLNIEKKDNKIYWISGEIKPVIRSPIVYQGVVN